MSHPKKILVILSEFTYVRNYLSTGALSSLLEKYEVKFAVSPEILKSQQFLSPEQIVGCFSYSDKQVDRHDRIFQILAWRYRRKSRTFFYRWLRQSNWNSVSRETRVLLKFIAVTKWIFGLGTGAKIGLAPLLGNRLFFPIAMRALTTTTPTNIELEAVIRADKWDLIVLPSAAFEASTFDAIRVANTRKIPTIALIDNWDNLVSKTVFWPKPSFLGVWGKQARDQAVRVQTFEPEQIFMIGTPRFDGYLATRESFQNTRGSYILFVGSAMPFDELGALHEIERSLLQLGLAEQKVVYRPHPWQQKRLVDSHFDEADFSMTVLDSQISRARDAKMQTTSTDTRFQPDLSHYPGLFKEARLVIGPLTTMLLEASLCLRPVIGLSYDDGHHFTTAVKYFSHFDGMEQVPGFHFCTNKGEVGPNLQKALASPNLIPEEIDDKLANFLSPDPRPYPERLLSVVDQILDQRAESHSGEVG